MSRSRSHRRVFEGTDARVVRGLLGCVLPFFVLVPLAACSIDVGGPVYTPGPADGRDIQALVLDHDDQMCFTKTDGVVKCWYESPGEAASPAVVPGLDGRHIRDVMQGLAVCAVLDDDRLFCASDELTQQAVAGLPTTGVIGAASNTTSGTCVLTRDEVVHCNPDATLPGMAVDHTTQIVSGEGFMCALRDDGSVTCWGLNSLGQTGQPAVVDSVAGTVPGLADVVEISAGGGSACARRRDGTVLCWGGSLLDDVSAATPMPEVVPGITGALQLTAGAGHACVLQADHTVACWGDDFACQTSACDRTTGPVHQIHGVDNVAYVSAGSQLTCARLMDGSARCWGGKHSHTVIATPHIGFGFGGLWGAGAG